jgi:Cft2 family RNA processing exonuclease
MCVCIYVYMHLCVYAYFHTRVYAFSTIQIRINLCTYDTYTGEDESENKSTKNTWRSVEHVRRPLPLFENILDMDVIEDSERRIEGESDDEGI